MFPLPDESLQTPLLVSWQQAAPRLESGATLVTANRRQARFWQRQYADLRLAAGETAWRRPDILPWGAWLARCFEDARVAGAAADQPHLLGERQALWLWRQAIEASDDDLLNAAGCATSAAEARARMCEADLGPGHLDNAGGEETRAFAGWLQRYGAELERRGCIDNAALPDWLLELWSTGAGEPPSTLLLAGFRQYGRRMRRMLDTLAGQGTGVMAVAPARHKPAAARRALDDPQQELQAAADWARRRLEANPGCRIAVVVPDLHTRHAQVERIFTEALHPARRAGHPSRETTVAAFEVSVGPPLAEEPLVRVALDACRLLDDTIPFGVASRLLRHPVFAPDAEARAAHLKVENRLRRHGLMEPEPKWLVEMAGRDEVRSDWLERLEQALQGNPAGPRRAAPAEWAKRFRSLLQDLGWPGTGLGSREHQALNAWGECLDELVGMAAVTGETTRSTALGMLERIAAERPFQVQHPGAPVQVMGLLEALGLEFDHLWVTGLDDREWPRTPRPNPLLPLPLQRRHGLPHADAAWELQYARDATAGLLGSAPEVVVSWPRQREDEDNVPSALIRELPAIDEEQPRVPTPLGAWQRELADCARLERFTDDAFATPAAGDAAQGGTSLIGDQAACPFRGQAHYRLRLQAPDCPQPGIDPMLNGSLAHRALQLFWDYNEPAILGDESVRDSAAARAAQAAVESLARREPKLRERRLAALAGEQLTRILAEWLAVEAGPREPFEVAAREVDRELPLGPLTVNMRVDRVDRLRGGGSVVIDYKTGNAGRKEWRGERPDSPQLPLYALTEARVDGVAFGVLKPGNVGFEGVTRAADALPGVSSLAEDGSSLAKEYTDWDTMLAEWQRVLEALAGEYAAGRAVVEPKKGAQTCRYCDLAPLCRIHQHYAEHGEEAAE